jgi:hypothetical protein
MARSIRSIEKSNDLIWNRTRDLPACITVPQPTTVPRSPNVPCYILKYYILCDILGSHGGEHEDGSVLGSSVMWSGCSPVWIDLPAVLHFLPHHFLFI